jgi:hypothetical protein
MLPPGSLSTFLYPIPTPVALTSKSHRIISFAAPHPLTLLKSYRFKNRGGVPIPGALFLSTSRSCTKAFNCNTYGPHSASVANKRLTNQPSRKLSPVNATTHTKKRGVPLQALYSAPCLCASAALRDKLALFTIFHFHFSNFCSFIASSTGAAMISRTRSRSAGTSSFVKPLVSMVSCR